MSLHDDNPVQFYLREVARVRPLTAQEEADLWRCVWAGGDTENAKMGLIETNLCLVVSVAERYSGSGVAIQDIIEKGNASLMAALDSSRSNSAGTFRDHASVVIERALSQFVRESQQRKQ